MKKYILYEIKDNFEYDYFIICLTYESIMAFIDEIIVKNDLNNTYILFDTLLINAEKENRFELAYISNKKININSFKNINSKKIPKKIKNITYNFFNNNINFLDFGVLTSKQKEEFLKKSKQFIN